MANYLLECEIGGGEADAYADDFSRQAAVCRASFKSAANA